MKKLIWVILVFIFTCIFHTCNAQVYNVNAQVEREVIKVLHFDDLTDNEKWVLLTKVSEAYYLFNKREIDQNVLLIFMEENNPICEWTGKHVAKGELFVRYYTVHRKYFIRIFDL